MERDELLRKVKALAERGVGGEKQNAEAILSRLMKKYGVSEADLREDEASDYDFHWREPFEDSLLRQIAYMIVGRGLITKRYVRSRAKTVIICCTAAQRIEIQAAFEFYRFHLKKGLQTYFDAFIQTERLFPAPSAEDVKENAPPENLDDMLALMKGMEKHHRNIQIERR
jgi:hypothetical protein